MAPPSQPSQDPGICPGIWIRSEQLPGGQDPVSELLLGGQDPGTPKTPAAPGANQLNLQHTQQPKVQAWQPPSKKLIFKPFFFIGAAPCPHYGINAATLVGHGPHQARIQGDPIGSGLCGPGSKVGIRGACAQDPSLAHGRAAGSKQPPKLLGSCKDCHLCTQHRIPLLVTPELF